jgi:hypothetical protein
VRTANSSHPKFIGRSTIVLEIKAPFTAGSADCISVARSRSPLWREPATGWRPDRSPPPLYFSCTEPDTLTTTLVLPASTGTGASDEKDFACAAIIRGRIGPFSLALTDTSRNV